ncbi:MAG: MerR family transcriptional regulator [Firmicutes bacterium]|nr:MerR family transcriptional regulator [Bacillota bacterium]
MKINQVEQLVGITKKNIRFYEEQGLLSPERNRENGYRDYSEADVRTLEQIKLLRKLGLPIEEIRLMQKGKATVADSMRRHLVTIEREQRNLEQAAKLCEVLKGRDGLLDDLDVGQLLAEMSELERGGTSFRDLNTWDVKKIRYAGAFGASIVMILLMAGLFAVMLWGFNTEPEDAPPLLLAVIFLAVPVAVAGGVILALMQRIREIKKGEADDARKF